MIFIGGNMSIYEKLEKIDKLKQHKRKVDQLKEIKDTITLSLIQGCYAKSNVLKMPEGEPPGVEFKEDGPALQKKHFMKLLQSMEMSRHQWERERIYTELLNEVHEGDAKILLCLKDRNLATLFPTFTKELMKEAFPNLKIK